ncbi:porin [Burkholderia glumae]|uniref:porin n=1 Tax=Burkholderia glumae TaxID=337 RepID=UPI0012966FDB|nr:porin [Burkholderia glumae]MCM2551195.1 porin [Burkholderia glumae]NVE25872.1 porin [Burkholderia glumae]QGA39876.1 porin [Burkholderia glumae]QJP69806.1 porin [Burkholderia glumae]
MTHFPVRLIAPALAALALATTVHAQSSVTLYGTIDTGVVFSSNQHATRADGTTGGHPTWQVAGGNLVPSRFGLTGSEDLGGDTHANFTLEGSLFSQNGASIDNGAIFNRNAWVGLANPRYGALTLGRQYDPFSDYLGAYASSNSWATLYGSHFGDVDNLNEAFNFNNSIKYLSPSFGGLTVGGLFSLGGVPGDFSQRRGWSVAASYARGPLSLSAGYLTLRNPMQAALGGERGYFGDLSCANADAPYCELQNAARLSVFGAGGAYTIGTVTVALSYTHTELAQSRYYSAAGAGGTDLRFDVGELNTTWQATPLLLLGAAYILNDVQPSGRASTRIHQLNLGATYSLSKRTALYAVAIGQCSGGAGLGLDAAGGATRNLAEIPNLVNSDTNRQVAVIAGIRHNF